MHQRFWLLTLCCFIVYTCVGLSGLVGADDTATEGWRASDPEREQEKTRDCKRLCGHCGGLGFYCGEECLCEFDQDAANTSCIDVVLDEAELLKAPYEILFQGSTKHKLLRKAKEHDQNAPVAGKKNIFPSKKETPNKRANIVIYKPELRNIQLESLRTATATKPQKKQQQQKLASTVKSFKKRSINQMDWFSDFAGSLVRPAPLRNPKRAAAATDSDEYAMQEQHSEVEEQPLDRSWFTDNYSRRLLQPSPLFKRHYSDTEAPLSAEAPACTSAEIPLQLLKDTLASLRAHRERNKLTDDKVLDKVRNAAADSLPMRRPTATESWPMRRPAATDNWQTTRPAADADLHVIKPTTTEKIRKVSKRIRTNKKKNNLPAPSTTLSTTQQASAEVYQEKPSRYEPSPDEPSRNEPSWEETSRDEPSRDKPSRLEPSREEPSREEPSNDNGPWIYPMRFLKRINEVLL